MEVLPTSLRGPLLIQPRVHRDARGFFCESYRRSSLEAVGVEHDFVQDNHSRSTLGVVRGMHFSVGQGQAKLVRCPRGAITDVVVDLRRGSPTFGRWEAFELDEENLRMVYVPVGFAHGFCVTSEVADVTYKLSSYYEPALERGFAYDDPALAIEWPAAELEVSQRDAAAPALAEIAEYLPFVHEPAASAAG